MFFWFKRWMFNLKRSFKQINVKRHVFKWTVYFFVDFSLKIFLGNLYACEWIIDEVKQT